MLSTQLIRSARSFWIWKMLLSENAERMLRETSYNNAVSLSPTPHHVNFCPFCFFLLLLLFSRFLLFFPHI
ncbi:hypothetical protein WN943_019358 [Citrus x changshan-huyou]